NPRARVVPARPFGHEPERDGGRPEQEPDGPHRAQPTSEASAAPDSSRFEMNPSAGAAGSRGPKDAASRLEISTTIGGSSRAASRSATAKPSTSGSWTSRRTTSG